MYARRLAAVLGTLGLGMLLATATAGRTQQPPPPPAAQGPGQDQQQDQEVLARGPVHEAFAEPVHNNPKPTQVVTKEPPPAIEEVPPDQKPAGENVQWIPGYWSYDDDRNDYIWVSGVWRTPPPDRNWVPGHWNQANGGWQWTPGFWMALQAAAGAAADNQQGADNIQYLPQPPEPVNAAVSIPAPNPNSVFVPGIWVYRDTRYLWRPGCWVDYRPGWVWIPAHYVWTPVGFVFVEGYWDLELSRRGLLFAPVYFRRPLWTVASWSYQPSYLVYNDFLTAALFVRPGGYYFGNYFEPQYRRRGFVAWIDYRLGNTGYDPLFSYYRWSHRDDRAAVRDLRELYAARFNGTAARPPVTLVQQNILIQNITNSQVTNNVTNVQQVTALASLRNANPALVRLQPVPRAQQLQEQKFAQSLRQASVTRARSEARVLTTNSAATGANARPVHVDLNLPKRAPNAAVAGMRPPPAPTVAHPTTGPGIVNRPSGSSRDGTHETSTRPNEPPTRPGTEARPPVRTEPPRRDTRPPDTTPPRTEPRSAPKTEPRPAPKAEPPRPQPPPPTPPRKDDKKGG